MRLKDIPADAEKIVTNKYVLWGGAAIAVLAIGYVVVTNLNANAANASSSDASASDGVLANYASDPLSLASNGQVTSSGTDTGTDYTSALLSLEAQQDQSSYASNLASINSSTLLGILGAENTSAAIQSSNVSTASQLIQATESFFKSSGTNAVVGSITLPDGTTTGINLADFTGGGKGSANVDLNQVVASGAYAAFNPTTQNAATSSSGSANNAITAQTLAAAIQQANQATGGSGGVIAKVG